MPVLARLIRRPPARLGQPVLRTMCSSAHPTSAASAESPIAGAVRVGGTIIEPAEVRDEGSPVVPCRLRELLPPKEESSWQLRAGGASALAGACVLMAHHRELLLPLLPDITGAALLLGGLGVASSARRRMASNAGGDGEEGRDLMVGSHVPQSVTLSLPKDQGVELELTELFAAEAPRPASVGAQLERQLSASEEKMQQDLAQAKARRLGEMAKEVEAELAAGVSPRRIRQRLNPRVFVVDFDVRPVAPPSGARQPAPPMRLMLDTLRAQVTYLLTVASPYDEVVLRITSPGGPVAEYGLAAAQIARLRAAGVKTTACIDLVAASGGYMMACVADRVLASPFAYIGSVGVVAGAPNLSRVLDRGGVEYVQKTSGRFKRTINIFQPNTEEGLAKFQEEIDAVHAAFKSHVLTFRPELDIDKVATGEAWLALHARNLKLVDDLSTADAYLRSRRPEASLLHLRAKKPKRSGLAAILDRGVEMAETVRDAVASAVTPLRTVGWNLPGLGGASGGLISSRHVGGAVSGTHSRCTTD